MSISSPFFYFYFFLLLCASPKTPPLLCFYLPLSSPSPSPSAPLRFNLQRCSVPPSPSPPSCIVAKRRHLNMNGSESTSCFYCLFVVFSPPHSPLPLQGIFPCSYIHLKNAHIKNKGLVSAHNTPPPTLCYSVRSLCSKLWPLWSRRQFETVIPVEDSVITEMTSTLRDWGAMWKQLYVVSRRLKFQAVLASIRKHSCPRLFKAEVGTLFRLVGNNGFYSATVGLEQQEEMDGVFW